MDSVMYVILFTKVAIATTDRLLIGSENTLYVRISRDQRIRMSHLPTRHSSSVVDHKYQQPICTALPTY